MPTAVDSGLLAALLLAGGVTAVVAIAMSAVSQFRASSLTLAHGAASVTLGLGVLALAGLGVVALSPVSAEAVTTVSAVTATTGADTATVAVTNVQLPTR